MVTCYHRMVTCYHMVTCYYRMVTCYHRMVTCYHRMVTSCYPRMITTCYHRMDMLPQNGNMLPQNGNMLPQNGNMLPFWGGGGGVGLSIFRISILRRSMVSSIIAPPLLVLEIWRHRSFLGDWVLATPLCDVINNHVIWKTMLHCLWNCFHCSQHCSRSRPISVEIRCRKFTQKVSQDRYFISTHMGVDG